MMKRHLYMLIAAVLTLVVLAGCNGRLTTAQPESTVSPDEEAIIAEILDTPQPDYNSARTPVGLFIQGGDDLLMLCAKHGFLRTAENLSYPAKVYDVASDDDIEQKIQEAIAEGVKGALVWVNTPAMQEAAKSLKEAGIKVIVPNVYIGEEYADVCLAPDPEDYMAEAARIMGERLKEKAKQSGVIVITGAEEKPEIAQAFESEIANQYPQYTVSQYGQASVSESVESYVEAHADLVGVVALEDGSASVWLKALSSVQSRLAKQSASAEDQEEGQPTPTPVASTRSAVIMSLDYTEQNVSMVEDGDIYAIIARPYYDSTAQSMAVMDRLLQDQTTQSQVRLNAPIIRKNGIDKYRNILKEVEEWFGLQTPTLAITPTPSPKETESSAESS